MLRRVVMCMPLVLLVGLANAADRNVVEPVDPAKPFVCKQTDIVRISGTTIAGGNLEVKVTGPAKVENTNTVSRMAGKSPVIGSLVKEWELKPSAKGKVTVVVTKTFPQPNSKPEETKYEFTVE